VSAEVAAGAAPRADQRERESAVALGIVLDAGIVAVMTTVSLAGGSFTLLAESIRGGLGCLLECFSYSVLRRIHRGTLSELDYGTGKLEQVANLTIGASMLAAALWIAIGALRILSGDRDVGSPLGLALAAMAGMVNLYINVVAWDGVRRMATGGDSLIMDAQVLLRWTKLVASLVIGVDLTVAALAHDDVVVAWADALGATFVSGYIAVNALAVLRQCLPDLLDRSAGAPVRLAVERALALHAGSYARLLRVRTRRSGRTAFVEIALAFDAGLELAEVGRRTAALEASVRETIAGVEVSVLASANAPGKSSAN
jgi:divalent metal cation (Fe/Co/Zn/Cd) transporter